MKHTNVFFKLAKLFKPDDEIWQKLSADFRQLGVLTVGGGIAGVLLKMEITALILFVIGCIIWLSGLFFVGRSSNENNYIKR